MLKSEHAPENQNVVGHTKMVCFFFFWHSYRSLLKQTRENPHHLSTESQTPMSLVTSYF